MNEKWFDDLKNKVDNFLCEASAAEIAEALRKSGYEQYTGISINSLNLKKPVLLYKWEDGLTVPFRINAINPAGFISAEFQGNTDDNHYAFYKMAA